MTFPLPPSLAQGFSGDLKKSSDIDCDGVMAMTPIKDMITYVEGWMNIEVVVDRTAGYEGNAKAMRFLRKDSWIHMRIRNLKVWKDMRIFVTSFAISDIRKNIPGI